MSFVTRKGNMLAIRPTIEQIQRAKVHAKEIGKLRNSIRGGGGNIVGSLGEIVCADHFGWNHDNTYDYDLVTPDGRKIDVKTKDRTVRPSGHFFASVADYNTTQECDYYLFCSSDTPSGLMYVIGIVKKDQFYEMAQFNKKGELDTSAPEHFDWRFRADCYNLPYENLNPIGQERL